MEVSRRLSRDGRFSLLLEVDLLREMAGDLVIFAQVFQYGFISPANILQVRATRMKWAAWREISRICYLASQDNPLRFKPR